MKLVIENFQCYLNKCIEINETGLHLFKGANGSGKSTILKALYWVWFGVVKKPYHHSHSTKTTKVILETPKYIVTRTRLPNDLSVRIYESQQILEGDAAQSLIYQILGMNHQQFLLSSYIRPHSRLSLATMTPSEQLHFIESFTFENDIHQRHSVEITNIIKEKREKLRHVTHKYETSKEYYDKELASYNSIQWKVKNNPCDDVEKLRLRIEELQQQIEENRKYINTNRNNDDLFKTLEQCKIKIKVLKDELKDDNVAVDDEKIHEIENFIELQKQQQSILSRTKEFEKMKQQYFKDVEEEFEGMKISILNEDELKKYEEKIKEHVILESIIKNGVNKYLLDENELRGNKCIKYLQLEYSKERAKLPKLQCPKCNTLLNVLRNALIIAPKSSCDEKAFSYEKVEFITRMIEMFREYSKIDNKIDDIKKKFDKHNSTIVRYEALQKIIQNKTLPNTLVRMKKGIPNSPRDIPPSINVGDLSFDNFNEAKEYCDFVIVIRQKNKEIHAKIKECSVKIAKTKKNMENTHNTNDLFIENEQLQKEIDEKRNEYNDKLEYDRYVEHTHKLENLLKDVNKYKEEMDVATHFYNASLLLEKKHQEAEILSLEDVIDTINAIAANYLNLFFDKESIQVQISILKKTQKDVKFKINTSIIYKGVEYASYDELSQGELVKVNLSYILALNQYFNSSILILDEFLENLDSEILMEVVDKLKVISKYKCVIVIDHSSIEGMYDHILSF